MDWFDVNDDHWLESTFGDVNADGYFDVVDIDTSLDGVLSGFLDTLSDPHVDPGWGVGTADFDPATPDATAGFDQPPTTDPATWFPPADGILDAPPW